MFSSKSQMFVEISGGMIESIVLGEYEFLLGALHSL